MLIVLLCACIALILLGSIMIHRARNYDCALSIGGTIMIVCASLATVIAIVAVLVNIHQLVVTYTIDERIEMYEKQNAQIEGQIEAVVKQYQEYESGIITDVGDKESYITLVSLYPELKADALVSKQIEVYMNNNNTISELKNQKLNEKVFRWWLYFGG